jgi:hypothetical protein
MPKKTQTRRVHSALKARDFAQDGVSHAALRAAYGNLHQSKASKVSESSKISKVSVVVKHV